MSELQSERLKVFWATVPEQDRKELMAHVREHLPKKGELTEKAKAFIGQRKRELMTEEKRAHYRAGARKRWAHKNAGKTKYWKEEITDPGFLKLFIVEEEKKDAGDTFVRFFYGGFPDNVPNGVETTKATEA